jgi:Holliday junction resolvase RusA-like endonuclease
MDIKNQMQQRAEMDQYEPMKLKIPVWIDIHIFINPMERDNIGYKFLTHNKFGDIDNLVKGTLDNLQATGHLKDDNLVVGLKSTKNLTDTRSCIVINFYKAEADLTDKGRRTREKMTAIPDEERDDHIKDTIQSEDDN